MVLYMASFWVIGGEYTDTTFTKLIAGKKKEKYGPFRTYDQAFAIWSEKSWKTFDDCFIRYKIIKKKSR